MMTKSIILILLLSTNAISQSCLENSAEDMKAINLLKAESLCQSSLKDCQDLFKSSFEVSSINDTELSTYQCQNGETSQNIPKELALAFGVQKSNGLRAFRENLILDLVDFYHHTKLHIERTQYLAKVVLEMFPDDFPGVTLDDLEFYMKDHDIVKGDPRIKAKDGKPFIQKLFEAMGKSKEKNPWIIDTIIELNDKEDSIQASKLKQRNIDKQALKFIKVIEAIADNTDRPLSKMSPQEFGKIMVKESMDPWKVKLAEEAGISRERYIEMVKKLENEYAKIFEKLMIYKSPVGEERLALLLKLKGADESGIDNAAGRFLMHQLASSTSNFAQNTGRVLKAAWKTPRTLAYPLTKAITSMRLDPASLYFYSTKTGCQEDGHHPWTIINQKCTPVPGLSKEFIDGVLAVTNPLEQLDSNTCKVLNENYKVNSFDTFNEQICGQNLVKLQNSKSQYINAEFKERNLKKLSISPSMLKSFGGTLSYSFIHSLEYDTEGNISKICFFEGSRGKSTSTLPGLTKTKCQKNIAQIKNNYPEFFKEISSLNYKIFQVKNCCDGNTDLLNESITCNQPSPLLTQN